MLPARVFAAAVIVSLEARLDLPGLVSLRFVSVSGFLVGVGRSLIFARSNYTCVSASRSRHPPPSLRDRRVSVSGYPYFTNWVRFLRFSGRLIAINHWI